jgi:hypothetical protein
LRIAALALALVIIKAIALWILAKRFEVPSSQRGEFAFVVIGVALAA